jgi:peroxiredoxin
MRKYPPGHLFFLLTLFLVAGCKDNRNERADGDLFINGKIDGEAPITLYFEELTPADIIPIDTLVTDKDGFFNYTIFIEHAGFYRIRTTDNEFITLAVDPLEKIYLTANARNFRESYQVSGSDGSVLLWKLNNSYNKGMAMADSLRTIYREHRFNPQFYSIKQDLKNHYTEIVDQQKQFVIDLIDQNPQSLASILALYQFFDDKPLLNENDHFQYFEKLSKTLCATYSSNKHVINLKKRVSDIKRQEQQRQNNEQTLEPGSVAPNISLPDPEGTTIDLSSLEGNIVLIDFWAAWCPPCRESNVVLADLYQKYKNDGFEIYGISLDRNKEQWIKAIQKDQISWKQVSDLRFMNSPVVSQYMVTEVPHYVLVDRERKIISRNFGIHELESLLKENL